MSSTKMNSKTRKKTKTEISESGPDSSEDNTQKINGVIDQTHFSSYFLNIFKKLYFRF